MNISFKKILIALALCIAFLTQTTAFAATPKACTGISKKCTKNDTYDKTIDGKSFSCYDCKQAVCKDGGNGGIAGTSTSSVCTEKSSKIVKRTKIGDFHYGGKVYIAPKDTNKPKLKLNNKASVKKDIKKGKSQN